MFFITIRGGRIKDFAIAILESDNVTPCILQAEDVVRVKIGRVEAGFMNPILDLSSNLVTEGGTSITFTPGTNQVTLRIGTDTAGMFGAFDVEVLVVVAAETNSWGEPGVAKRVDSGVLFIHRGM